MIRTTMFLVVCLDCMQYQQMMLCRLNKISEPEV